MKVVMITEEEFDAKLVAFENRLSDRFRMMLEESGRTALLTDADAAREVGCPNVLAFQARVRRDAGLASLASKLGSHRRWRRADLHAYLSRERTGDDA